MIIRLRALSAGSLAYLLFSNILGIVAMPTAASAAQEDIIPAIILKVEGDGSANVRKRSGVIEAAGARGKVFVGDRVITDSRSAVHLMLNDGSVLKIGFNSEFKLDRTEDKRGYISWVFVLVRGSIRALVEKISAQETHLRVETPSGTIGVRGTEFVLVYDEVSASSSLYMIEGLVNYGVASCEKTRACLEVRAGESATMPKEAHKPTTPVPYSVKELFDVGSKLAAPGADAEARMSLFRDARHVNAKVIRNVDESGLKKILDNAITDLAAAQDRAIGRTKEQREAMHEAIKHGTYESAMVAADSYAAAQGIFNAASNGGAENLVAQVAAAKFRLGSAVQGADAAGLFLEKSAVSSGNGSAAANENGSSADPGTARSFQLRKSVPYDEGETTKANKDNLSKAAEDYKDTLEYAEALAASQVPPVGKLSAPAELCEAKCRDQLIAHEQEVASEGSVNAYQAPVVASESAKSEGVPLKHGKGGLHEDLKTRYFKRTVRGDSCFRTQSKCKMQPCSAFSRGGKCKTGETTQICENRQVPVRCKDK